MRFNTGTPSFYCENGTTFGKEYPVSGGGEVGIDGPFGILGFFAQYLNDAKSSWHLWIIIIIIQPHQRCQATLPAYRWHLWGNS
jgi:hypothetical protein